MDETYFVANWKSHKNESEAREYIEKLSQAQFDENKVIIICPPTTLLAFVKNYIHEKQLDILVGAQNISEFGEGPYTGEENVEQIKEFADYVIIGHSERRRLFGESNETILKKAKLALTAGLNPIICVDNDLSILNSLREWSIMVAYEPVASIGTGTADDPTHASKVAMDIKQLGNFKVLYGGSVNGQNISSFTKQETIDGVLVGSGSLNPSEFLEIINNG